MVVVRRFFSCLCHWQLSQCKLPPPLWKILIFSLLFAPPVQSVYIFSNTFFNTFWLQVFSCVPHVCLSVYLSVYQSLKLWECSAGTQKCVLTETIISCSTGLETFCKQALLLLEHFKKSHYYNFTLPIKPLLFQPKSPNVVPCSELHCFL